MNTKELQSRLNYFALRLIPLCDSLPKKRICRIIEDQLLPSGFSAAANYRSACNAQSKKSFHSELSIALEEIDEACFGLEMIGEPGLVAVGRFSSLSPEPIEPTRILGASRRTARQKLKIENQKLAIT